MDQILIVEQFVKFYSERLSKYFHAGGRDDEAGSRDLKEFMGQVTAIANDPNGNSKIEAVYFENGQRKIKAALKFDTSKAKIAVEQINNHRREIEKISGVNHTRVLMIFQQSNIKMPAVGKRTGEQVLIEAISDRTLPLIYASQLAEEKIKHEIKEADDNIFKKGLVVDVNVEMRTDKPVAYKVTELHQVIDLPDE